MKLTVYIRPTARRPIAAQEAQARKSLEKVRDKYPGGISIIITEGDQGRTWENALKQLGPINHLLIENFQTLHRIRDIACERIEQVFDKSASIVDEDGEIHEPRCRRTLLKALRSRGLTVSSAEPKPRLAHNKTPDDVLKEAKRMWTQKQFAKMTNKDISEAVGVSVVTLIKTFGKRGRPAGRPRK